MHQLKGMMLRFKKNLLKKGSKMDDGSDVSRGLGDTIYKITEATGIKAVVEAVTKAVGIDDCGCEERRRLLNEQFPYNN